MAWRVEQIVAVTQQIRKMVEEDRPKTTLVPRVDRNFVLEGIVAIATKETAKDNVRLRAFELLGKLTEVGLFKDAAPEAKPRTIEEIDKELRERLAELANVARVIDGTATVTKPATPSATNDRRRKPKV